MAGDSRFTLYSEAIQIFAHVLKDIHSDSTDTYNNLGVAYLNTGQYREAIETLQQAIVRKPNYLDAHYNLALAYHAAGKSKDTMDEYTLVKNLSPEKAAGLLTKIQ